MYGPHVSRYHAAGARPSMAAHVAAACAEAKAAADFEVRAVSLFVGGPHNRAINLRPEERAELRGGLARAGVRAIAHSSYAAPPWGGDPDAARYIRDELAVCQEAGITGLVVHLPKAPPAQVAKYAARLLNRDAPDVRVYLETPALVPRETYYETSAKLAALFAEVRRAADPGLDRFGLCVDTAHLWTNGVDLSSYEGAQAWFDGLEAVAGVIPPDRVMLHLNDSLRPRGVGPDTHAPLGRGQIWGAYRGRLAESGLAAVVAYAARHETPVILERKPKEALAGDYLALRSLGVTGGAPAPVGGALPPAPVLSDADVDEALAELDMGAA